MTHSLHRVGSEQSLADDYVILITPAGGINNDGALEKLLEIVDFIEGLGPNNIGDFFGGTIHAGYTFDDLRSGLVRAAVPRVRCCFDDSGKVRSLLAFIKERDFGLSVTVSGLVSNIKDMCDDLGLTPHSINLSLQFHGQTSRLPDDENVMKIVTMCGHGMISPALVIKLVAEVRSGRISAEKAAQQLAHPCLCGIFNTQRAATILKEAAAE